MGKSDFSNANIPCFPLTPGTKVPEYGCKWTYTLAIANDSFTGDYGIAIPLGYVVVDADLYKPGAMDALRKLQLPLTYTVLSARGGKHYWYILPKGVKLDKKNKAYPGIDILTHGMYVVGPGSKTSDGEYRVENTGIAFKDLPAIPQNIVDIYSKLSEEKSPTTSHIFVPEDYDRYVAFLSQCAGGVKGQGCNDYTYQIAARGKDFGLPKELTYKAMVEHWNPRCVPNWPPDKLYTRVKNAYTYGTAAPGKESVDPKVFEIHEDQFEPQDLGALETQTAQPIGGGLKMKPDGGLTSDLSNLIWVFQNEMPKRKIDFRGLFKYDENAHRIVVTSRPFFRPQSSPLEAFDPHTDGFMSDDDYILIRVLLSQTLLVDFSKDAIRDVILAEAKKRKFHPIRDWLSELEWDGVERVGKLFTEYFNLPSTAVQEIEYRQYMAKGFLLAAIYRIFNPGYKWDYMLTLTGPEGTGKSTFAEEIGKPWASTAYALNTDKKTLQALDGKWIVEFPEMSATRKTDFDQVKAFLSSTSDTFIPMYGREAVTRKRQCIFVWSLNPQKGEPGFLKDQGQNRRFHIIDVPVFIDLEKIKTDRGQMFAEAMAMYRQGITPYSFVEAAGEYLANAQANARVQEVLDPWEETLSIFLEGKLEGDSIKYGSLYDAVGLHSTKDRDLKASLRIRKIMGKLGWGNWRDRWERGFLKMESKEPRSFDV